jgi:7 transmembrane sweet-taste receptor of 3 GCPR
VAELADLRECGVVFPAVDLISGVATTVDAMQKLWTAQAENAVAVIGPIQKDIFDVAVPSTMATGLPLVDHYFGTNENTITTTITVGEQAAAMIAYLSQSEIPWSRLAVLCARRSCEHLPVALQDVASKEGHVEVFLNQFSNHDELGNTINNIKDSGARAWYIDVTDWSDLVAIAAAMKKYEVMGDDLLLILPPNFVQSFHSAAFSGVFEVQDGMSEFLAGSLVFGRLDGFQYRIKDKFLDAWRSRYKTKADEYPIVGASFAYDSVLAVGFGLCNKTSSSIAEGIESLNFRGASGLVRFELTNSGRSARRRTDDVLIGAFNVRQNAISKTLQLVRISTYSTVTSWMDLNGVKYVYRDGTTIPPVVSETFLVNNHIDAWALSLGILSVNIILLIATATIALLWYYRKEHVVRRSQPAYQCQICIGCMVTGTTTAALSHYSNYTTFFHNNLCTVLPWTFVIGQVLINSAEFAKLWRVNQVTSLIRIKRLDGVSLSYVPPLLAIVPLIIWTIVDRMKWAPSAMVGDAEYCTCDNFLPYAFVSGSFVMVGVVMTLIYAMRSRRHGVPDEFQDGEYVARAASIQAQTLAWACVAYLVGLDNHASVTASYMWRVLVVAVVSLSPICIIILPKLYKAAFERGIAEKMEIGISNNNNTTTQHDTSSEHQSSSSFSHSILPGTTNEEPSMSSMFDPSLDDSTDSYFG